MAGGAGIEFHLARVERVLERLLQQVDRRPGLAPFRRGELWEERHELAQTARFAPHERIPEFMPRLERLGRRDARRRLVAQGRAGLLKIEQRHWTRRGESLE